MKALLRSQILIPFILLIFSLNSCIVQAPKYARVEKVLELKLGMSKAEVSNILGIPPYDIKFIGDSNEIYIYKYRVTDRRTVPFLMKETNGKKVRGKYVDLFVTYSKAGNATFIESCSDCEDTKILKQKLDFNQFITLVSVTVPAVLLYLGLK